MDEEREEIDGDKEIILSDAVEDELIDADDPLAVADDVDGIAVVLDEDEEEEEVFLYPPGEEPDEL